MRLRHRHLGKCLPVMGLLVVLPLAAGAGDATEDFSDFSELKLEDLLAQEVVSVSRFAQELRESPMSVNVLTREDIRRSGATSIPEVLRLVPGMHVMASTGSTSEVSTRGMSRVPALNMLVMIDGRSVYTDLYGFTLWEFLPIDLYEIESIEVIRGPGSALYGANAFAGVINIITQDPSDDQGTLTRGTNATDDASSTALVHAERHRDFAYRVSAASGTMSGRAVGSGASSDMARFNAVGKLELDGGGEVQIGAGHSNGVIEAHPIVMPETIDLDGQSDYLRADYRRGQLSIRGFWNRSRLEVFGNGFIGSFVSLSDIEEDVVDVELQHGFDLAGPNPLIYGASYRSKWVSWAGQDGTRHQDLVAAFVHHERHFGDRWLLTVGTRWDHHPQAGQQHSPRAALVYLPGERHTIRASFSQAHRNPTYFESFWSGYFNSGMGSPVHAHGDENLKPERVRSFELGYQGLIHARAMVGATLFHSRIEDISEFRVVDTAPSPPAPVPGIPSEFSFLNARDMNVTGLEFESRVDLPASVRFTANYTYTWAADAESGIEAPSVPRNLAVLGLRKDFGNLRTDLWARYRGIVRWENIGIGALSPGIYADEDFLLADLRLGYPLPGKESEFFVFVENVFDEEHRDTLFGADFGRRVIASIVVGF